MSLSKYLLAIKTPGQPLLLTPRPFQSNPSCIHTPFPSLPNRTTSKFLHPIIITSITALVSSFRLFWAVTYLLTCFNLNSILRNYAIYLDHCGITQAILLHQGIIADCFGNVLHIYCLLPSSFRCLCAGKYRHCCMRSSSLPSSDGAAQKRELAFCYSVHRWLSIC